MQLSRPQLDAALLGVDLGGSGVRVVEAAADGGRLAGIAGPFERAFAEPGGGAKDFEPIALERQLAEARRGSPRPARAEREEGARRLALIAEALVEAAAGRPLLVALAAPGLRAADGRGLVVARNGPRLPTLLADLEAELARRGARLARPLPPLIGDGAAAGWGELLAHAGALGDASGGSGTGWVLVGGSGVAECWVHGGRVRGPEELRPPLSRAWELAAAGEGSAARGTQPAGVEDLLAPARLNARWRASGRTGYPELAAAAGDPAARALLSDFARGLGAHLARRRAELAAHPEGAAVGRFVLGGALAPVLARAPAALRAVEEALVPAGRRAGAPGPPAGEVVLSALRAAPALGALAACLARTPSPWELAP